MRHEFMRVAGKIAKPVLIAAGIGVIAAAGAGYIVTSLVAGAVVFNVVGAATKSAGLAWLGWAGGVSAFYAGPYYARRAFHSFRKGPAAP